VFYRFKKDFATRGALVIAAPDAAQAPALREQFHHSSFFNPQSSFVNSYEGSMSEN
jgi:hypothetical protein